jgi:AcrR family transcriptional regulator
VSKSATSSEWREARRQSARDAIVDAAWALVHEEGLAALSLRDLAKRAGITTPTVYAYFESKNAIYDAMYADGTRAYVAAEANVPVTGDPLTDLKAGVHFFVKFCTEDVERYQLLFQRTIPGFEPSPESFAISVESLEKTKARFASIGLTDPEAIDLMTALGTGLADQQISNDPGGDRWIRLIDEAMEMLYAHLVQRRAKKTTKKP